MPKRDALKLWQAACFAADAFIRLSDADLTDEEMALSIAPPDNEDPQAVQLYLARTRITMLSLLAHDSPLSRRTARDLIHPKFGGRVGARILKELEERKRRG